MPSICCYFQVHQPFRLGRYSYFSEPSELGYFDEVKNGEILRKVAQKCYLPANRLLLQLIERHQGKFKIAFSLTGLAIEQMERYSPETLQSFVDLSRTGCVE